MNKMILKKIKKYFIILFIISFTGLYTGVRYPRAQNAKNVKSSDPQKPSILLITIDTLRADALDCYGAAEAETPVIDIITKQGVLFENVMCQAPATGPSFASMMTSRYATDCGGAAQPIALHLVRRTR